MREGLPASFADALSEQRTQKNGRERENERGRHYSSQAVPHLQNTEIELCNLHTSSSVKRFAVTVAAYASHFFLRQEFLGLNDTGIGR